MKKFRFFLMLIASLFVGQLSVVAQSIEDGTWEALYYKTVYGNGVPADNWYSPEYDDGSWDLFEGPLNTQMSNSDDYYFRMCMTLTAEQAAEGIYFQRIHDDGMEVYVNGECVFNESNWSSSPQRQDVSSSYLIEGANLVAFRIYDTGSGEKYGDIRFYGLDGSPILTYAKLNITEPQMRISKSTCKLYAVEQESVNSITLLARLFTPSGITTDGITWESADPQVATVVDGKVTAVGVGETDILAKATVDGHEVSASCHVTVVGFSTDSKVVILSEPGTLRSLLTQTEIEDLTKLTVLGPINGTDVKVLREMAGSDYNQNPTGFSLEELDLSAARIVSGGESYFREGNTTWENTVGSNMFRSCTALKKIILPSSITRIDYSAFANCSNLKTVQFTEDCRLTSVNSDVFANSGLVEIKFPKTVTSLGSSVFQYCQKLTSVNIEELNLVSIPQWSFNGCRSLQSITIPASVENIGESAFNQSGLKEIIFAEGSKLTAIPNYGFYDSALEQIELPESCTGIGEQAFANCYELKSVTLSPNQKALGKSVFRNCSSLTSLTFPAKLRVIGEGTFEYCSSLNTIIFPEGTEIREMGERAFAICDNLANVYVMNPVPPTIAGNTFDGETPTVYVMEEAQEAYQSADVWSSMNIASYVDEPTIIMEQAVTLVKGTLDASLAEHKMQLTVTTPTGIAPTIVWTVADDQVATINQEGLVQAVGEGKTTVTATITYKEKEYTAQCEVSVLAFDADKTVVYVTYAGTLYNSLTDDQRRTLTEIVVAGNLNDNDISCLRNNMPKLQHVAFAGVNGYVTVNDAMYRTSDNRLMGLPKAFSGIYETPDFLTTLPDYAFDNGVSGITGIVLGEKLTRIEVSAFQSMDDSKVTSFVLLNPEPVSVESYTLSQLSHRQNYPFIVPAGSLKKYQNSEWGNQCSTLTEAVDHVVFRINEQDFRLYQTGDEITGQKQLTVFGMLPPAQLITPSVEWTSSDETIAKVSETGLVTLQGAGEAIITATTVIEGETYTSEVKVTCVVPAEGETVIYVATAGTLREQLTQQQIEDLTQLTVVGNINANDFVVLREMAGRGANGLTGYLLRDLDLSGVNVEGESIPYYAFQNAPELRRIVLPANITCIEGYAFQLCSALQTVIFTGQKLKRIEYCVFDGAPLKTIDIPDNVEHIGCSFQGCTNLESVNFTENSRLKELDGSAFYNTTKLTHICLPSGVRTIGENTFSGSGIQTIVISENSQLETIERYAFARSMLTSINIPETCTSIGEGAFAGSMLTSINIPETCTSIGEGAFSGCDELKNVKLPDILMTLNEGTFSGCDALETIILPRNLRLIGSRVFWECEKLTTVVFPEGTQIRNIGELAFSGNWNLRNIFLMRQDPPNCHESAFYNFSGTIYVPADAVDTYKANDYWKQFEISGFDGEPILTPSKTSVSLMLGALNEGADQHQLSVTIFNPFNLEQGEESWTSADQDVVTVSETGLVQAMGNGTTTVTYSVVFGEKTYTVEFEVESQVFDAEDNVVMVKNAGQLGTLLNDAQKQSLTSIKVVGNINDDDFRTLRDMCQQKLETIDLSAAAATLYNSYQMQEATNLKQIELPQNLTHIPDWMFANCRKLESISIPEGVQSLGHHAFRECSALAALSIPATLTSVGEDVFGDCDAIRTINVAEDNTNFELCSGILYHVNGKVVILPNEINGILTFPDFQTTLPSYMFNKNVKGITGIILGENITRIDEYAFQGIDQSQIQSIAIKNPEPISVEWYTLQQFNTSAYPVIVPIGSLEAYRNTNWGRFSMLMETVTETTFRINQQDIVLYKTTDESTSKTQLTVFAMTPTALVSPTVQWRSLNEDVAVVEEDGTVIMTGAGTTTIVASAVIEGKEYTSQVNVECVEPAEDEMFVFVREAGTLENLIPSNKWSTITNLALFGQINSDDVRVIREMAGRDTENAECEGSLRRLDLSQVKIVYGENTYKTLWGWDEHTYENQLGTAMFAELKTLETVILPNSVTNANSYVFYNCDNLKSVILPQSLNRLSHQMFFSCDNLESISIPASVRDMDSYVFQDCSKLASVTFEMGSRLTNISDYAFQSCRALTSITIPATVNTISSYAFDNAGLQEIIIPENSEISSIGTNAFNGTSLKSFYVPEKLRNITAARINNDALEAITVHPDNTQFFAYDNVLYKKADNTIALMPRGKSGVFRTPDFMTSIPAGAFSGCQRLSSIVLSSNVASIGNNAFNGCVALNTIFVLNAEVIEANEDVFSSLDKDKTSVFVPVGSLAAYEASAWNYFENIYEFSAEPQLWLATSDVTLYDTPIEGTRKRQLEGMIISAEGPADAEITWSVSEGDAVSVTADGLVEAVKGGHATVTATANYNEQTLTADCEFTVIGGDEDTDLLYVERAGTVNELLSAEDRQRITNLVVMGHVNSNDLSVLGDMARSYGGKMESLDLSQVDLQDGQIGWGAFETNTSLKNVLLPDGLHRISEYAFRNSGLEEIIIPESVAEVGHYAFGDCNKLKTVTLFDKIANNCSTEIFGWNPSENILTMNISISDIALDMDKLFERFDSRTSIKYFQNGEELTEIIIPEGTQHIGARRFFGCQSVASLTVPASVESIGNRAFEGLMEVHFLGTTPATLTSSEGFSKDAVYIVPAEALTTYRSAAFWSDFKGQIIPDDAILALDLDVTADNDKSAVVAKAGGEDKVEFLTSLTLHGSINSYDIFAIRTKMPNLHVLDLTDVEIVANPYEYYTGSYTENHRLGKNAFIDMTKLVEVHLPMHITEIGERAFAGCTNLRVIEMHEGIETIGSSAFVANRSMKRFDFPNGIKSVGSYLFSGCTNLEEINFGEGLLTAENNLCYSWYWEEGRDWSGALNKLHTVRFPESTEYIGSSAFESCSSLKNVVLPKALKSLEWQTFAYCNSLENVVLPSGLYRIGGYAFRDCSSLRELRLPPMLEQIDDYAFIGCDNIKDVYTYVVVPKDIAINQNTFTLKCYEQAMLHVPDFSRYAYMWNTQWGQFSGMTEFNEPYETFYAKNTLRLDNETGGIKGEPDADVHETGAIVVEGDVQQNLGNVDLNSNGTDGGSLIPENEGNLTIKHLNVKISVEANRWYFFCFPFNVPLNDVKYGGEYVWRQYDGAARSRHEGGWRDLPTGTTELMAGRGYIFQGTSTSTLHLNIHNPEIRCADTSTDLETYQGADTQASDANWNFVGNPYTSYYEVTEETYSAPITIWTGNGYEAYRPGDDDYELTPYQAFFVQSGNGNDNVNFNSGNRSGKEDSDENQARNMARRMLKKVNPDRLLVNLVLTAGDEKLDKTRVVLNNNSSSEYEASCDAAKFFCPVDENGKATRRAEIYTLGADGTSYAINERPEQGDLRLGFVANEKGMYSIGVERMEAHMLLVDNVLDITHDLLTGPYEFTSAKGTFNKRFTLKRAGEDATSLDQLAEKVGLTYDINGGSLTIGGINADTRVALYTTGGQLVDQQRGDCTLHAKAGVYVLSVGSMSVKVVIK